MCKFILLSLLLSISSFAEEMMTPSSVNEADIMKILVLDSNSDIKVFTESLIKAETMAKKYVKKKKEECLGSYSSITIDDGGVKKIVKKKLNYKEKKHCKLMLVNFQIKYTRAFYKVRKRHLKIGFKRRVREVEAQEHNQVLELEKMAKKYR